MSRLRSPKPTPAPVNIGDHEVAAFLADGRPRAALKRLKHLGRRATANDIVTVVQVLVMCPSFDTSRLLLDAVLKCAQDNQRLEPTHKAALREALSGLNFAHITLIGQVPDRAEPLLERPEPLPERVKKTSRISKTMPNMSFSGSPLVDAEARTFQS